MESYCVIHFKDKPEKVKILTFLASETEADFKVTTDLKKYVAKQFGVTILENGEKFSSANNDVTPPIDTLSTGPQQHSSASIVPPSSIDINVRHIETTTIKDEIEDIVEDVVTPPIDTLPIEQHLPSAPIILPSPIDINAIDQQVPVVPVIDTIKVEIDDTVEDTVEELEDGEIVDSPATTNNTYRNFVFLQPSDVTDHPQNLTSMVEPKQELVDDEMGVVDQSIEQNMPETEEDASSTSEGNRKRPYYSAYDYNDNETAVKKRKDDEQAMVSGKRKKANKCQKCTSFNPQYQSIDEHVMMHAKIRKYICLVDGCGYKTSYNHDISMHMQKKHEAQLECFREHILTDKDLEEIEVVKKTCFPEDENQCQVCNHTPRGRRPTEVVYLKREHAIFHLGIKLYNCTEDGCCHKVVSKNALNTHKRKMHGGVEKKNYQKDKLTAEQELQVEEMLVKCFPN